MSEYTAITPDGKYLLHYGVKGMKWGKRKSRNVSSTSKGGIEDWLRREAEEYGATDEQIAYARGNAAGAVKRSPYLGRHYITSNTKPDLVTDPKTGEDVTRIFATEEKKSKPKPTKGKGESKKNINTNSRDKKKKKKTNPRDVKRSGPGVRSKG